MTTDKITMFRARNSTWQKPLTRVLVDRASDSSAWIGGVRVARQADGRRLAHDFGVVKKWLVEQLTIELAHHQKACEDLQKRIADIEAMSEADVPEESSLY